MAPPDSGPGGHRLTDQEYWNSLYRDRQPEPVLPAQDAADGLSRRILKKLVGPKRLALTRQLFSEYHFWNMLLPRFISRDPAKTVLEVGSAPGNHLIDFHRHFGYNPIGVEYTTAGVASNRRTFIAHGLDPDSVIEADFFSPQFQERYANQFDAVLSRGFIEHFDNVEEVIAKHAHVLKPGGSLIVNVPNLTGMHLMMVRKFVPHLLPLHNLSIMRFPRFRNLFQQANLEEQYCGYQGGIHLLMADIDEDVRMPRLLKSGLRKTQVMVNLAQSYLGTPESRYTSPYLLYVGRKTGGGA